MKLFSNQSIIQPIGYWAAYAKNKKRLIVFCEDDVLDLTDFVNIHPGGDKAIYPYLLHDIKSLFFRIYPHSNKAFDTLQRYKCGRIKDHRKTSQDKTVTKGICKGKSNLAGKKQQQGKKVSFCHEEVLALKTKHTKKQKDCSESSLKNEESNINFEQNKPTLFVPYFNTRIDCFSKQDKWGQSNSGVQKAS